MNDVCEIDRVKHDVRNAMLGAYVESRKILQGILDMTEGMEVVANCDEFRDFVLRQLVCVNRLNKHLKRISEACVKEGKND